MLEQTSLIERPDKIYNIDESWFNPRNEKKQKVVVNGASAMPYKVFQGAHAHVTLTLCIRADGEWVPPMFTFKGSIPGNDDLHVTGPTKAFYSQSQSGHIDSDLYFEYIKHIEPLLHPDRPVVILQDNHSCHENSALIEFCLAKKIHLFNFPPKVTHLIQPLDKMFGYFQDVFQQKRNDALVIQQSNLPQSKIPILTRFTMDSIPKSEIRKSFAKTGIYPVNREAITRDLLVGDQPKIANAPQKDIETPLLMEAYDENDREINSVCVPMDVFHADKEVQTDPPSHLPCSECTQNDVALHPAVAAGIIDIGLATAFIPDACSAQTARPNKRTTQRNKNKKARWLTSESEMQRKIEQQQKEAEEQNRKRQEKEDKEAKKREKEEEKQQRKIQREENQAARKRANEIAKEKRLLLKRQNAEERRNRAKRQKKMKPICSNGRLEEGQCPTCSSFPSEIDIILCVLCNERFHKHCIDEESFITICSECRLK